MYYCELCVCVCGEVCRHIHAFTCPFVFWLVQALVVVGI